MSVAAVDRMKQRADEADVIIAQLRSQLDMLKNAAVTAAYREEERQLTVENAKLRQDVLNMKEKLCLAEQRNGVVQVKMPTSGQNSEAAVKIEAPIPVTVKQESTSSDKKQQSKEKGKKQAKQETKEVTPKTAEVTAPVDVSRLDMRVGHIVDIKKHPDADGLYVEQVDLGEGRQRTIVSGLVNHVPMDKMLGRLAIFCINLKPAKMRGILSEGMIMCASSPQLVEIIDPPEGAAIGDRISVDGFPGSPDALLNPKKKIWEQVQPDLQVDAQGLATYKGAAWVITGKGECKAPTARNQGIK